MLVKGEFFIVGDYDDAEVILVYFMDLVDEDFADAFAVNIIAEYFSDDYSFFRNRYKRAALGNNTDSRMTRRKRSESECLTTRLS